MKRIAITVNTAWNIYNFRLGLVKALQAEGYEVVAIAPYDEYVEKLRSEGVKFHNIEINNKGVNPIEELILLKNYFKTFKQVKPDLVLTYTIKPNIYGVYSAGKLGIPVISNISGLGTVFLNNNLSSIIARNLYKLSLKYASKVFFQNPYDRDLFVKNKLVNISKTSLLPGSGINPEKFSPIKVARKDNKFRFLMIARMLKDKGVVEYIKAAEIIKKKYPDTEFLLLGAIYTDNPTALKKDEIEIWEKKGVIKYLGKNDNVQDIIASCDCVVLPSYREGLSRVLLEGASMAKPIITTDVPGCRDVVEDNHNGFLCKPKNYHDLAEQMEKMLLLDENKRNKMGMKGREKILKSFDEKIVIKKYLEAIKELS